MVRSDSTYQSIIALYVAHKHFLSISRSKHIRFCPKKVIPDFEYFLQVHLHGLILVKPCR